MNRNYVIVYRVGDEAIFYVAAIMGCADGDMATEVFFAEHDPKLCRIVGVWHVDFGLSLREYGIDGAVIENTYRAANYIT